MLDRLVKLITSLKLTVVCLAFALVLVFIGTVAQVNEGLYLAQNRWFRSFLVLRQAGEPWWVPPVFPGGYLIGIVLLVNLLAAHAARFHLTWRKLGIHLTHAGIILLLVGQLVTDLFSRETQMRIFEGETKSWSESGLDYELAFVTDVDAGAEEVVAIPQELLTQGAELKHEKLPFTVRVKTCWPNSTLSFRAPMQQNAKPLATNGVARHFDFTEAKITRAMNDKNVPTALIELVAPGGSLGEWVAPGWSGDATMNEAVAASYARQMGRAMAATILSHLTDAQSVEVGGRTFTFVMRPARAYKPFSLTLLRATHDKYPGTDIPKDFRSRVRIQNSARGEDREVEIYMNSPLRYAGLTFFQFQMAADEMAMGAGATPSSTFQVVRNPSWLTPYAGCVIVAAGLITQFMIHLVGFISRRKAVA